MTSIQRNRLLGAFLADLAMNNMARYAARGRRYAGLDDDALDRLWTETWRHRLLDGQPHPRDVDYDDLSAELRLRGRGIPRKLIARERRRHVIARAAPLSPRSALRAELEDQLRDFFEAWRGPRH